MRLIISFFALAVFGLGSFDGLQFGRVEKGKNVIGRPSAGHCRRLPTVRAASPSLS